MGCLKLVYHSATEELLFPSALRVVHSRYRACPDLSGENNAFTEVLANLKITLVFLRVEPEKNDQNIGVNGYVLNNPLSHVDPSGEFIHLIIGAVIGGVVNWATNGAEFSWKGLAHFGVGAVAGALSAGIGAGVSSAIAGASFSAGFMGTSAALTATSSFFTGAAIGGSAGFGGGFVTGLGNGLLNGQGLGQSLGAGFKTGLMGGLSGGLLGGISGGIDAALDGRRFFDGATVQKDIVTDNGISLVGQRGDNNCLPASAESIDGAFGGNLNQDQMRSWFPGTDANIDPLADVDFWSKYASKTGSSWKGDSFVPGNIGQRIHTVMQSGGKVAVNLNLGNNVGHSVAIKSSILRTITKINGSVIQKYAVNAMNPGNGGSYLRYSENLIRKSFNVFYLFK